MSAPLCRSCFAPLRHIFVDLGTTPLCESYLAPAQCNEAEPFYPLRVFVCERCYLVQLEPLLSPQEIFTEYAYFSSYSDTWVRHARDFAAQAIERFQLGPHSFVVEAGSNDGYLLQHFVAAGIPVLGIEPAANVAVAAQRELVRAADVERTSALLGWRAQTPLTTGLERSIAWHRKQATLCAGPVG